MPRPARCTTLWSSASLAGRPEGHYRGTSDAMYAGNNGALGKACNFEGQNDALKRSRVAARLNNSTLVSSLSMSAPR
jgi:hypothetical protein